jgi:peroxiredoxin
MYCGTGFAIPIFELSEAASSLALPITHLLHMAMRLRRPAPRGSVLNVRNVIAWLVVALVALVAFRSAAHAQAGRQPRPERLPAFSFTALDGRALTNAQLQTGIPTVVLFFDPDCDHCQRQAEWICASESLFGRAQFLWVSTADVSAIRAFGPKYLATSKLKHHFARDAKYQFDAWFGYSVSPTILAFDATGKLRQAWSNETAADAIAAALK